jgi:CubicO group peptidase (beta-lactamase class C family)
MTKPVVGTSVLMLMEEGKVRLTDPVSRFIPQFREMKVAVIEDRPAGARAPGRGTRTHHYSGLAHTRQRSGGPASSLSASSIRSG